MRIGDKRPYYQLEIVPEEHLIVAIAGRHQLFNSSLLPQVADNNDNPTVTLLLDTLSAVLISLRIYGAA